MIRRFPDALSLRFFRAGAGSASDALPDWLLETAHRFRCAAAIRCLAAADIFRLGLEAPEVAPSVEGPFNTCRSSEILASIRFFCSSKPARAAVRISFVSFVGM
jgi:hypothetical protein